MPTYEYRCERGHTFEKDQRVTDEPIRECLVELFAESNCCGVKLCRAPCKRQLFPVGFQLSGSGWSRDGYSSTGGRSGKRNKKKES